MTKLLVNARSTPQNETQHGRRLAEQGIEIVVPIR
jgi:hypothetical protein